MTQEEYLKILNKKLNTLEKIADNTERQVRFLQNDHRSLLGLMRLLQVRDQLLKLVVSLTNKEESGQEWKDCVAAQESEKSIRRYQKKIIELQAKAIQVATEKKNSIAEQMSGNRVTRNIRNVYIGRWYQGLSRGFSREV